MSRPIRPAALLAGLILLTAAPALAGGTALTTVRVASGLDEPLFVLSPPGDQDRLFLVEQTGAIRILLDGTLLPQPFLDLGGLISCCGEQGLLGVAFHPGYADNGRFFVSYTDNGGDTVLAEYAVSGANPNLADPVSGVTLFTTSQPFTNHNGGMIAFGPDDGYLYFGLGDGGGAGDTQNNGQDLGEFLGKLLRIDVDGGLPYAIPPDNPFLGDPAALDEIWAYGLRNPWRFSFDRDTGDLYIGDVGQNSWEEVDFQPADSSGGENYGWRIMEGNHCHNPAMNCDMTGLVLPIAEYPHFPECSVTGGYVYRGCAIPDLQGTYFFADWCSGQIWSFRYDGVNLTEFENRTAELAPDGASIGSITSFGEDALGELYIVDGGGEIFKIVAETVAGEDCNADLIPDSCKDPLDVSSGPLTAGGPHTFTTTCGTPGAQVFLAGSIVGPGATQTPAGPLGLAAPRLLGQAVADAGGSASFDLFLPPSVAGRVIWWQAIESPGGETSDVETDTVQ